MRTETEELNYDWIVSPEGIEAWKGLMGVLGWSNCEIGTTPFLSLKGDHIEYGAMRRKRCPSLNLRLIVEVEKVLKKQWQKKTGNTLRLFIEDPDSVSIARYTQIIDDKHHVVMSKIEPTELIARATALLAVRDWLDKEKQ